jgi:cytochrome o ubiquinol oxidase subunit 3
MNETVSDAVNIEQNAEKENTNKTLFGFWIYLMTDCVLFAALFATFIVLRNNTFGGPNGKDIFQMPYILTETLLLLVSSFTCGLAMLAIHKNNKKLAIKMLVLTFVLGLSFLTLELVEFRHLVLEGHSWRQSAFLSSYFTLVGISWFAYNNRTFLDDFNYFSAESTGYKEVMVKRTALLSMFWHFLDIIWIFIFSIVYLMGVV